MSVGPDTTACPKCGRSWVGGKIPEKDRDVFGGKTHFSLLIGQEVPGEDRISSWVCPHCKATWGRA